MRNINLYDDPCPEPGEVGNRVMPWNKGSVTIINDLAGVKFRGRVGEKHKMFDTMRKAKLWVTRKSGPPIPLDQIKPEYKDSNPKLDFYAADGRYVHSSNYYLSVAHAWAHQPKGTKIHRIVRSTKHNSR